MGKNQYVSSRSDGTWQVKGERNQKATAVTRTQYQAIQIAREIAINQQAELIIKGSDGCFREKNSYGNDPHPPKG